MHNYQYTLFAGIEMPCLMKAHEASILKMTLQVPFRVEMTNSRTGWISDDPMELIERRDREA
jgi:hypothetical protein